MSSIDLFYLDKQTAVVTGGSGNLGPFWVKALLEAGCKVAVTELPGVAVSLQLKKLQKIYKSKLKSYRADVVDVKSLERAHKLIKKDMGLVQILVNNAGIDAPPQKKSTKKVNRQEISEKFKAMWGVNVQGIVNCIEEFAGDMKTKKQGSIINIGSLYLERSPDERFYDHLGFDKPWAYGSTKAAVDQLTRHFATRLAKYGIRVNTLSLGGVFSGQEKQFVKKFEERVPMGRMADKQKDLAGPLIFLASEASSYVTGINLQVNGGYTAW